MTVHNFLTADLYFLYRNFPLISIIIFNNCVVINKINFIIGSNKTQSKLAHTVFTAFLIKPIKNFLQFSLTTMTHRGINNHTDSAGPAEANRQDLSEVVSYHQLTTREDLTIAG